MDEATYRKAAGKTCAVVLAAGFSTRMKRFKPLLPFGGGSVLSFVLETYRRARIDSRLVVGGHNGALVREEALRCGARFVLNPAPERGMFSSVSTGLAEAARVFPDALFFAVHPVDIPLVGQKTLEALVRASAEPQAELLKPSCGGEFGHPPLIARSLLPRILEGDWNGGLRQALLGVECQGVEVEDKRLNLDMDRPEEYGACLETLQKIGRP